MFSSRLPLSALIELCRVVRHYMGAGLTLPDVFRQQEKKGPTAVRAVAGRIADRIEHGQALEDALKPETKLFPPMFLSLASVGERTGMLPEVFTELERYFKRQKQMRDRFIAASAWPIIQFVLAVLIVSFVICVLGLISKKPDGSPDFDPLGLGLAGPSGALIFMGTIFGTIGGLILLYILSARWFGGRASVDRFLLSVPALGPCLQALALSRFCLALRLTTESAMSINKALRLSLTATSNSAYVAASPIAEKSVKDGDDLTVALSKMRLLPKEFEHIIEVAEESGQLTEVLRHQADHYYEETTRRMAVLTAIASTLTWMMVAGFIIVIVFRFFLQYLKMIDSFLPP
jgi:type II secretory pathway component PulF